MIHDYRDGLNVRQRYRIYRSRVRGYGWMAMTFRQWHRANGQARFGQWGYA